MHKIFAHGTWALLAAGTIEIIPPDAPLTLFIWGAKRILPVRITDFSQEE